MIIPARFNGPPATGNGGYSAGVFSAAADGVPEVTLRMPPPLDVPFTVDGPSVLSPDGAVVATVRSVDSFPSSVPFVPPATAAAAATSYPGFAEHPFPTCYVCGTARDDGLRVFPGPAGDGLVAAPFRAPASVTTETMWAALDCPGGWSIITPGRPYVLGRMAAVVDALAEPGAEHVVVGKAGAQDGRKAAVESAVFTADGTLIAHARATWVAI
jgi:hypothetical protein